MNKILAEIKRKYNENFELLKASVGTSEHEKYLKIEEELNQQEIALQKELGIYLQDPCPIGGGKVCENCTGWVKTERIGNSSRNYMVRGEDEGAFPCALKR